MNGFPKSGKDTFVNFCLGNLNNFGRNISTVDFVKQVAEYCGWDRKKTFKNRKFLSDLKNLLTEWDDVPYKKVQREITAFKFELESYGIDESRGCVFLMAREPEEIARYEKELGAKSILIRRKEVEGIEQSNEADKNVLLHNYDFVFFNDGSTEDLKQIAKDFCEKIESNLKF